MNVSYEWLRGLVPVRLTPAELRDLITARCATVDELVPLRADLRDVVVGRVVEAGRHPSADRLWVTKVDAGKGELLDVVCGAPLVVPGKLYPFAPAGSTLPGGVKLEKRKIRGATSNGMLCSARELALGEDQAGILELDVDAAPGTPLLEALQLGDTLLVIDVLPNRPDLLSHLGFAREVAAATGMELRLPALPSVNGEEPARATRAGRRARAGSVSVELEHPAGCPRYMGVVIRGVRVAPSPQWLAERLAAVGGRPINSVVDATNYILHELGQPMHAFDVSKLAGGAVVVRAARAGERLRTLDGVERTLGDGITVIADAERAQAVAGVMGGAESEVREATTDIFLEVATFDPTSVRRARRTLGLSTDASYRFERGTDIELPPAALARAVALIRAVAGGETDGPPVDLYPAPRERPRVALRVARAARVLGDALPDAECERLLRSVGFEPVAAGGVFSVSVPSWRVDVAREIDLIEEIARLRGYDSFPDELRPYRPGTVPESPLAVVSRRVREALVAAGLLEARPMPFVAGFEGEHARVANPLAENEAYLRRELLETLARRAEYNLAHMQGNVRLFEIGSAFQPGAGALPREEVRVAALVMGDRRPAHWTDVDPQHPRQFDEWDAKWLAEVAARAIRRGAVSFRPADGDRLWEVELDGQAIGSVRRLRLDAPVWASPAYGVELVIQPLDASRIAPPGAADHSASARWDLHAGAAVRYRLLPTTPASGFDVALIVPDDLPAERVEVAMRRIAGPLLERLALLSEFRGGDVPAGSRSVAWRLTFRHPERTLESKEMAGRREKLLRTLEGELGVRQRTA
jgi:phenylalanyl-tRNA synthetase beta chain